MSTPEPVDALRSALGEMLPRDLGPQILFQALRPLPNLPRTQEEVDALVRGSLRDALIREVGEARGVDLSERLAQRLSAARPARDADATRSLPTLRHPVPVMIVAASTRFSDKLAATLGPQRVKALACTSLSDIERTMSRVDVAIAVVDASDFASIEPPTLALVLAQLRPTTPRVVWSASLPYGRALVGRLKGAVSLEADEGVEPLLDLVRSRRNYG